MSLFKSKCIRMHDNKNRLSVSFDTKLCICPTRLGENLLYGKCSKNWNTFLFLFSNKMLVFGVRSHEMLVKLGNKEDSNQTAS